MVSVVVFAMINNVGDRRCVVDRHVVGRFLIDMNSGGRDFDFDRHVDIQVGGFGRNIGVCFPSLTDAVRFVAFMGMLTPVVI